MWLTPFDLTGSRAPYTAQQVQPSAPQNVSKSATGILPAIDARTWSWPWMPHAVEHEQAAASLRCNAARPAPLKSAQAA